MHMPMALWLVACSAGDSASKDTSDPPPPVPSDTATAPETGGDSTETESETGPPPESDCPSYSGLSHGRWTEWRTTADYEATSGFSGTARSEVQALSGGAEVHSLAEYEGGGLDDYIVQTVTTYRCDADGVWLTAQETSFSYSLDGVLSEGASSATWSPAWQVMPAELAVGAAWESTTTLTQEVEGTEPSSSTNTYKYEVLDALPITTPAGTLDSLYVLVFHDGGSFEEYRHAEIGDLVSESMELTGYGP